MKTLKAKVTIMVSVILIATMGIMTAYSLVNSNLSFVVPMQAIAMSKPAMPLSDSKEMMIKGDVSAGEMEKSLVAMEAFDVSAAQKQFGVSQLGVMLLIALCGMALTYAMVARTLKPLGKLIVATTQIDANKLSTKIDVAASQDEVAALAQSFNSMLGRLNNSFELQKNFAQNAAHELKTPLAVIKSSLQVLELDAQPTAADYKENSQIVKQSTDELIEIVEQLLTLTEKIDTDKQQINLGDIIDECVDMQKQISSQMEVKIAVNHGDIDMYSNALLIKSVLCNLISNAVKYNRHGGSVTVDAQIEGENVKITVCDTGIGIEQGELSSIFEPFYRADESRNKKVHGNGLGLSIVKASIEKLGGEIKIASNIGEGTAIEIILPA